MNVRETWVVYGPVRDELRPVAASDTELDAWACAWHAFYAPAEPWQNTVDEWVNEVVALGWRCLRVVPAEGQT